MSRRTTLCALSALIALGCGEAQPPSENVGEVASEVVQCPEDDELEGIDVSYYQAQPNWASVAGAGITFAITRVNHGDFLDPEFGTNWQAIKDNGMIRGAYQYFDPGGDPVEQAQTFIDEVGVLQPGDLPGVIDVESTDGLSPAQVSANVGIWIDMVEEATGRQPMIYTGSYFWNDNVSTDAFNDHPLWIAHYTNACPNMPEVWNRWAMWQYSATGSVAGINGDVDTNVFNGNLDELNDFAANGYRADVISVDAPTSLAPGEVGTVTVVLDNLGARTWGTDIKLGTTMPRDRVSPFANEAWDADNRVLSLESDVATGETLTLSFSIIAPAELGSYTEHFNLVREGVAWFSDIAPGGGPTDETIAITVEVTSDGAPPDDPIDPSDPSDRDEGSVRVVLVAEGEASCAMTSQTPEGRTPWWFLGAAALVGVRRRRAS